MNSAGCSTCLPANGGQERLAAVDVAVPVEPAEERAVVRERLGEHVEVLGAQPVERPRKVVHQVEEAARRRVEEAVLVAGHVARQAVEDRAQGAAEVGVELALGDTGLLEVQEIEERVAHRRAHRLGRRDAGRRVPARYPRSGR